MLGKGPCPGKSSNLKWAFVWMFNMSVKEEFISFSLYSVNLHNILSRTCQTVTTYTHIVCSLVTLKKGTFGFHYNITDRPRVF